MSPTGTASRLHDAPSRFSRFASRKRRRSSGLEAGKIPAGNRLKSYRTARSAFPASVLDPAGSSRESGKTGLNGGKSHLIRLSPHTKGLPTGELFVVPIRPFRHDWRSLRELSGCRSRFVDVQFDSYGWFKRKSIADGYLEVFGGSKNDPGASPDWQRAAAGTVSEFATSVSERVLGYQSPVRARTHPFEHGVGRAIRSHAPVHADGQTPFTSTAEFENLGHWSLATVIRVRR